MSYEDTIKYLPTPAQIRACCIRIQKTWTPEERERRMVIKPTLPVELRPVDDSNVQARRYLKSIA